MLTLLPGLDRYLLNDVDQLYFERVNCAHCNTPVMISDAIEDENDETLFWCSIECKLDWKYEHGET